MFARGDRRLFLSAGERSFYTALVGVSFLSAIIAFQVVTRLSAGSHGVSSFTGFDIWAIIAGCVGGGVAFTLSYRRWFGFAGWRGFGSAVCGGIAVSFVGSLIAGTMVLPFYGTMFGPFQLIISMITSPLLCLLWWTNLISAHLLIVKWRDERDSIFESGTRETRIPV